MALDSATYLKIGGKPLRFADELFDTLPRAMQEETIGTWLFNRDTDNNEGVEVLERASKNRAPGANQGPEARRFVLDTPTSARTPTASQNYWRSKNGSNYNTPLQTDILDIDGETRVAYVVCAIHKADAALLNSGVDATNNRATVIGTYGNTIYKGWTLEYLSPVIMRFIGYDKVDGIKTVNLGLPGTATDANPGDGLPGPWVEADLLTDLWRIIRVAVEPTLATITNISGDSSVDEVTVAFPNGYDPGLQPMSILGRVAPLSATNYLLGCSVMLAHVVNAMPSSGENTTIIEQIREQMRIAGITELSSIG